MIAYTCSVIPILFSRIAYEAVAWRQQLNNSRGERTREIEREASNQRIAVS